ncbi:MAG TPA: caspase family protein [Microthrixaceae bacterium]|nr:caspase family protein [Microthrixaceae bacterium]HMT61156.1 caspase family protein [Microthrixaceae bacterium]
MNDGARRAVCVGIDRYTVPGAGLQGCVADALAWRELLVERSGVDAADIVTLTDEQATGQAVRDAVGALIRASAPGDTAVLVIASHGSWKVDRGGDEADRYDETICPHDCDRGQIGDDELGRLLDRAVDGVRLTVVVDACHSGTVTRGLEPGDVARTLSPWIADPAGHGAGRRHRPVDRIARSVPQRHLLIAACGDQQSAVERRRGSQVRGLFSSLAIDALRASSRSLSARSLATELTAQFESDGVDQRPVVSGPDDLLDAPVFR